MTATTTTVTEPGVYDMLAAEYHADPVPGGSLSSTGARLLLSPSCPAVFRWRLDHPELADPVREFGTAVHDLILGTGGFVTVVEADTWRTKEARAAGDEARAAGIVPLLRADYERVRAMDDAVRQHELASRLLDPAYGDPERSLFWTDDETGAWCRARLDWLPRPSDRRMLVVDLKTTASASPTALARSVATYGYHAQAAWYLDAVRALGLDPRGDAAFVWVFVEKTPPYLVTVAQPDPESLRLGRQLSQRALRTYVHCRATDTWPGHADGVATLDLPRWAVRATEDLLYEDTED